MGISILGVVPARGNSQRLPRKNSMSVGGRTLIQRTADAINESLAFSSNSAQTIVSTEGVPRKSQLDKNEIKLAVVGKTHPNKFK